MNGLRKTLVASGLAVLATSGAQAADLYQPPMIEPLPVVEEEFGSSWYLRGYVGMSNQEVDQLTNSVINEANDPTIRINEWDSDFDSAPVLGAAIGLRLNDWIRADVSAEYRGGANYHGMDHVTFNGADGTFGTGDDVYFDNNYTAVKREWLFLANGFVDLGSWNGLMPYVGAGIGTSRNTITSFRDMGLSVGSDAYAEEDSKWNFAWALHAGLGYQVTPQLTMELGYRYLDLGDAVTGNTKTYDLTAVDTPDTWTFEDLTSHDVHLGFRYAM